MQELGLRKGNPALKQLVAEASRALALLDADRLEELALSCQALNRQLTQPGSSDLSGSDDQAELYHQAADAAAEMAVFGRVLEVTRANLAVTSRLSSNRQNRLEYTESQIRSWTQTGPAHGDN